jgi:hypothetical protein
MIRQKIRTDRQLNNKMIRYIFIWLTDWLLTVLPLPKKNHIYGDVTITFEQGEIFIVQHLLWHRASVIRSHPKDRPIQSPLYLISTKGAWRVWPVSRGCLLLHGTWSSLRICRRSLLPYTRFCNCLLITITFYTFAILYFNHRTCISAGGQPVPEDTCRSVYILTWVYGRLAKRYWMARRPV